MPLLFQTNPVTANYRHGCHSDDVCTTGNATTCQNNATCTDLWNEYSCNCTLGNEFLSHNPTPIVL